MILALDFTKIPREQFSVATASELYDDYISTYHAIPKQIYIYGYQRFTLASPAEPSTWRGVELVVK